MQRIPQRLPGQAGVRVTDGPGLTVQGRRQAGRRRVTSAAACPNVVTIAFPSVSGRRTIFAFRRLPSTRPDAMAFARARQVETVVGRTIGRDLPAVPGAGGGRRRAAAGCRGSGPHGAGTLSGSVVEVDAPAA